MRFLPTFSDVSITHMGASVQLTAPGEGHDLGMFVTSTPVLPFLLQAPAKESTR